MNCRLFYLRILTRLPIGRMRIDLITKLYHDQWFISSPTLARTFLYQKNKIKLSNSWSNPSSGYFWVDTAEPRVEALVQWLWRPNQNYSLLSHSLLCNSWLLLTSSWGAAAFTTWPGFLDFLCFCGEGPSIFFCSKTSSIISTSRLLPM